MINKGRYEKQRELQGRKQIQDIGEKDRTQRDLRRAAVQTRAAANDLSAAQRSVRRAAPQSALPPALRRAAVQTRAAAHRVSTAQRSVQRAAR
jgi:hypothetical protein